MAADPRARGAVPPVVAALLLSCVLAGALWHGGLIAGEGQRWVLVILAVGVAATLALHGSGLIRAPALWDWRWGIPSAALALLVLLQAANPSHRFIPESRGLLPIDYHRWLPASVDRASTLHAARLFAIYTAMFWLARQWLGGRPARTAFLIVQTGCALLMAAAMLVQRAQGPDGALYPVSGAFVGPNHYAAYANLVWPVVLMTGVGAWLARRGRVAAVVWGLSAMPLLVSVWFSGSRMGMAVSGAVLLACLAVLWRRAAPRRGIRVAAWVAVAALIVAAVWTMATVWHAVRPNVVSRAGAYAAMLRMWGDHWFAGTGAGTFGLAFPYYQPDAVSGFFRHAHNEVIQVLCELGTVGAALLTAALAGMLGPASRAGSGEPGRTGVRFAMAGLLLHAMTDFPFRLPALAMLAAAWMGWAGPQVSGDDAPR